MGACYDECSIVVALALNNRFANDNVTGILGKYRLDPGFNIVALMNMKSFCLNTRFGFTTMLLVMVSTFALADLDSPGGIGAYLELDATDYPVIKKTIPDTPAAGAKLKEGQHITKVNGVSTAGKGMEEIIAMIRGPEMTAVELEILGADGKSFRRLLCRKAITIRE